ncbi:hypothetical protein [Bacillus mycoides]|uniref:hypothetical protein n=1 Tax=Bacillus mycoides TaxID=1405 RepID=UPI001F139AF9|nr:hypothetical protein [Bacillus mycoides]
MILQDPIIEYEKTVKNLQNTNAEWHTVVFYARAKLEKRFKIQRESQEILVPLQEPTAKISIQSLEQNKIEKVDAADSNVKMLCSKFQTKMVKRLRN